MARKSSVIHTKTTQRGLTTPGCSLPLALTLVPLVIGLLLIGAWALDISIFEAQSQITVGILFILLGFAASNALQKRWKLAAGWALLMLADFILLVWLNVWAQGIAIGFGLVGVIFLAVEFFAQYQHDKSKKAKQ